MVFNFKSLRLIHNLFYQSAESIRVKQRGRMAGEGREAERLVLGAQVVSDRP